ncbi:bifunctional DNA primase/polymerase [Streptomyces sp. NPDC048172]|uniref:bifunctional DNA primase/polymerase n=1 Tax=Streptomyces sp. NPDC048172 TaxID=3365505 RepID=UPI003719DBFB
MESGSRFAQWLRRKGGRPRPEGSGRRSRGGAGSAAEAARVREELLLTAAAAGFPLAPAAHPSGYGCSCVRIGCPTPGRHPVSFAWQTQATTDRAQIERWLRAEPLANFVTATGQAHDVLDVPAEAGYAALGQFEAAEAAEGPGADGTALGPVALDGGDRMLFFTATRGTPDDEDEWWPCELDCHPETMDEHPGLRWHCRGSYVLLPPAVLPGEGPDATIRWIRPPEPGAPMPEPLALLATLTDACAVYAAEGGVEEVAPWPVR